MKIAEIMIYRDHDNYEICNKLYNIIDEFASKHGLEVERDNSKYPWLKLTIKSKQ